MKLQTITDCNLCPFCFEVRDYGEYCCNQLEGETAHLDLTKPLPPGNCPLRAEPITIALEGTLSEEEHPAFDAIRRVLGLAKSFPADKLAEQIEFKLSLARARDEDD